MTQALQLHQRSTLRRPQRSFDSVARRPVRLVAVVKEVAVQSTPDVARGIPRSFVRQLLAVRQGCVRQDPGICQELRCSYCTWSLI